MKRPLEKPWSIAGLVQGWAGHPSPSRPIQLTSQGTPDLDVCRDAVSHVLGENKFLCLLISLSFLKRPPWFIGWSNNALATVPSLSGMVGNFLKPQFHAQHERLGFLTARNHVRRPLGLAHVDQPMAQLHACASHF